jgi:hypothetical protein
VRRFGAGRRRVKVVMRTKEVADYQLTVVGLSSDQRRRAVITVASSAGNAAECVRLLDILGLRVDDAFPEVPAPRT